MTDVGVGQAGIVMGLEVSRLARNNADWHRLLEICALADTLILDEDGVYDPASFNDRLLLGLKGTMSEAELHVLKTRLRGESSTRCDAGSIAAPCHRHQVGVNFSMFLRCRFRSAGPMALKSAWFTTDSPSSVPD